MSLKIILKDSVVKEKHLEDGYDAEESFRVIRASRQQVVHQF